MRQPRIDLEDHATREMHDRMDMRINGPINVDEARELDILRSASFEPVFDPNFKKDDKKGEASA